MKKDKIDEEAAWQVAVAAFGFVAADFRLLQRFLALSGIDGKDIRQAAKEEGFLAGVLNFLCANEHDLLAFCASIAIEPGQVSAALTRLPCGKNEEYL